MTVEELLRSAALYADDDIEQVDALTAVNEALIKIGDMAFVHDETTLAGVAPGVWHPLPSDLTSVVSVKDVRGRDYPRFKVMGAMISFGNPGDYKIRYRRMPKRVTEMSDTPEVPAVFFAALATYLKSWFKLKEDEDSEDGMRLRQEFSIDVQRAYNVMLRGQRRGLQIPVVRTPFPG